MPFLQTIAASRCAIVLKRRKYIHIQRGFFPRAAAVFYTSAHIFTNTSGSGTQLYADVRCSWFDSYTFTLFPIRVNKERRVPAAETTYERQSDWLRASSTATFDCICSRSYECVCVCASCLTAYVCVNYKWLMYGCFCYCLHVFIICIPSLLPIERHYTCSCTLWTLSKSTHSIRSTIA